MATLIRGVIVAGAVALAVLLSNLVGLEHPWPVLLTAAVAIRRPMRAGPVAALLVGAAAWWLAMALRAGVLPATTTATVVAAAVAVLLSTVVAAASRDRLPLWAALAGSALYAGLYEPVFADSPTTFLADSPLAFATLVVATGIGAVAAALSALLEGPRGDAAPAGTTQGAA